MTSRAGKAEMVLRLVPTNDQHRMYIKTYHLASDMWPNKKVREREGGEAVWKNSRNELGYTPEDLCPQVDWKLLEK
jgi:hypothetical protein